MKIRAFVMSLLVGFSLSTQADDHTSFAGISLDMHPTRLMDELCQRGLFKADDHTLTGRLAGVDVLLRMNYSKDTSRINSLLLTTLKSIGGNQRESYASLMQWMRKHYGAPTWESFVRSHPFARWYVEHDKDIVMIATGASTVEVWFYENHENRNVDYYSILKYCERNPADGVPNLTAQQSVTWKNTAPSQSVSKKVKKGRNRKYYRKNNWRSKKGNRAKRRQRRRSR